MKRATAGEEFRFKPLWRIRNATYRRYARGYNVKRLKRYVEKLRRRLGMKH